MEKFCYLNGKILPLSRAAIPINDLGILRGYGLFDFLRTYGGQPFLFREHWRRFERSAKLLRLRIPIAASRAQQIVRDLMRKNHLDEATARFVLTGGASNDSFHFGRSKPNFFIIVGRLPLRHDDWYRRGVALKSVERQREFPIAKSNGYLTAVYFKNLPASQRFFDLLYRSRGRILEGASCNFFLVKGNALVTARDDVLLGVTRGFVLGLAKKKMSVEERPVLWGELEQADEAFITTTTKEILPVVKVDKIKIGSGKVGEKTKMLMGAFRDAIEDIATGIKNSNKN